MITAINAWAASLVRYSAGIVNWTMEELRLMDRKTRKIMTMNRMYHPQSDVDRLYIPRKEGGRGLLNIMECVENEEDNLGRYVNASNERLIKYVKDIKSSIELLQKATLLGTAKILRKVLET